MYFLAFSENAIGPVSRTSGGFVVRIADRNRAFNPAGRFLAGIDSVCAMGFLADTARLSEQGVVDAVKHSGCRQLEHGPDDSRPSLALCG